MEDRYEIKSKIGQGGFGSVYRAFDKRMNREVAIKRINSSNEDGMLEEASRQLSKEAGALSSLQHPNIITIYDVGSDEDGPYVVMELLSGSALDELVDKAPLTWEDFRELAMQTQEALIGAQELELVHRDIKPANVMLAWLPSGKFQVKLLDFGLAKLTQRPSLQTLNQADSIFGSIFFMSPEQFERAPIDRRTDMYAMGCVYYYALTGSHPFDGSTAVEVMSAHLHHDFVPLDEVRPDLPKWICDWVMWHMNRYPDDRPDSAREALQVFVQNDKFPPVEAPTPAATPSTRPRLLIPGAEPLVPGAATERRPEPSGEVRLITKTAPQPLVPPTGKPSVHSSRQLDVEQAQTPQGKTGLVASVGNATADRDAGTTPAAQANAASPADPGHGASSEPSAAQPAKKKTLPQKNPTVSPPTGGVSARPAEVAASQAPTLIKRPTLATPQKSPAPPGSSIGAPNPNQPVAQGTPGSSAPTGTPGTDPTAKPVLVSSGNKPIPNSIKIAAIAVASLLILIVGWSILGKIQAGKIQKAYNEKISLAAHPETTSVPVDREMLAMMLDSAVTISSNSQRETVFRALFLASPTDGTDIDMEIVRFATEREMMDSVRQVLISQVLRRRGNPEIVKPLLDFAMDADNASSAAASLQAIRALVDDSHMDAILNILQFTTDVEVRRAAEEAASEILNKSGNRQQFTSKIHGIFRSSVNDDARHTALRLSGRIADPGSLDLIRQTLREKNPKDQTAALTALTSWRDEKAFPLLVDFITTSDDPAMAARAFESGIRYGTSLEEAGANALIRQDVWSQLAGIARTPEEQERLIRVIATNSQDDWIIPILERFATANQNPRIADVAQRAISSIKTRRASQ